MALAFSGTVWWLAREFLGKSLRKEQIYNLNEKVQPECDSGWRSLLKRRSID